MAIADEKLQKLFDNELTSDEAEALRRDLGEADLAKLDALMSVSQSVKSAVDSEAAEHQIDVWSQIEGKLDAGRVDNVVPLRRKVLRRTTAVLSALALAATLVFVWRPAASRDNSCDVEELEVVGGGATVLKVADDHGNDTTLIWFDHQEEDEWESL